MDYQALRRQMVDEQIISRGIKDPLLIRALYKIERHKFIPEESRSNAYGDFPVNIGEGQTISQPYIVALMTESLSLVGKERVLEIGTGSGYQTAILAELASSVYTVERLERLSVKAKNILDALGYVNIKLKVGDGTLGWLEEAPFDRIVVTAASLNVPQPLLGQLADKGKLLMPLGESFAQMLTLIEKQGDALRKTEICGCVFVPLVGKYGWRDA